MNVADDVACCLSSFVALSVREDARCLSIFAVRKLNGDLMRQE